MTPPTVVEELSGHDLNAALEIEHYSHLIAGLMVSAARTNDRQELAAIHSELVEAFADIFTLLSHDSAGLSHIFSAAS